MVIYGYREPDLIAESKILHFDHRVFREFGADKLANQALSLLDHVDRLWFHLDVDVLDPTLMPVCFPEPNGLAIDETETFLTTCLRSKRFIGMSVSCYHPNLDPDLKAASRVVGMLVSALMSNN